MRVEKEPSRKVREYLLPGDDQVEKFLTHKEPLTSLVRLVTVGVLGAIIGAQGVVETVRKITKIKGPIKKSSPDLKALSCLLL